MNVRRIITEGCNQDKPCRSWIMLFEAKIGLNHLMLDGGIRAIGLHDADNEFHVFNVCPFCGVNYQQIWLDYMNVTGGKMKVDMIIARQPEGVQ